MNIKNAIYNLLFISNIYRINKYLHFIIIMDKLIDLYYIFKIINNKSIFIYFIFIIIINK